MQKRMIDRSERASPPAEHYWLDIEPFVQLEITSQDAAHPIESALLSDQDGGWRAAEPGKQTIRLRFDPAQTLLLIHLEFVEAVLERTQEFVLRWSADGGRSFREVVRQHWNFNP